MGRIATVDGRTWTLGSMHIVGGDASADTPLIEAEVSIPHARLSWDGSGWEIRDLGSTNGTWTEGRRLEAGRVHPIEVGERFRLGQYGPIVELVDAGPPVAMLVDSRTGAEHLGTDSLVAWPDGDHPDVVIAQNADEEWNAEWPSPGEVEPIEDRDKVKVGGRTWVVRLPGAVRRTLGKQAFRPDLRFALLEFRVPSYEEDIDLRVIQGAVETRLGVHTQHYMLYRLAQLRERDMRRGVGPDGAGWVAQEELLELMNYEANNFYVEVHRARTRLEQAGVEQAGLVVERRRGSRQVRLGVPRFSFVRV